MSCKITRMPVRGTMAEMEGGKACRKSDNIMATLARGKAMALIPNDKQHNKREQDAPKKSRMDKKKGLAA
jgi:hypothetical protein